MDLEDLKVVVVGAGTMGHSICQVYAQAGYRVSLVDLNSAILDKALSKITSNLDVLKEFNMLGGQEIPKILNRIQFTTDLKKVATKADLIVEAVFERADIKRDLFVKLDEYCSKDTIFASNTSGLNVFKIAKISHPERLIIHHWFAPPHVVPLVEVVPGRKTSDDVIEFSLRLLKRLGKKPITLRKFSDYFIVNRIQNAISSAVFQLILMKTATPEDIDVAVKHTLGIRLPIVGVVQTLDFTGLDLVYDVVKNLGTELGFIKEKIDQGHLGVKTSKGIYDYGNRSEEQILRKRDEKYLKLLNFLWQINAFEPI
ncbi:MAG: 3-hydroxyacyl-CoA dehydrogenase family protein [Promethearchaeota archaeon]